MRPLRQHELSGTDFHMLQGKRSLLSIHPTIYRRAEGPSLYNKEIRMSVCLCVCMCVG